MSGRREDRPPGKLVQAAGAQLHANIAGQGSPAIVFEAGIAASSLSWTYVQRELAKTHLTISYDRSGLGWSPPCVSTRNADRILAELHGLLTALNVPRPYVLVGHSFGALIVRIYAGRYPEHVAGLVLVDPALLGEWAAPDESRLQMLRRGIRLSRRGAWLARMGIVRSALTLLASGSRLLPKLIARASSGRAASVTERLVGEVRKLPPELWPVVRKHWSHPKCFDSMAGHLSALPEVAAAAARVTSLGDLPLIVISGAHLGPEQLAEHRASARLSSRGRHITAPGGGHWVHLDAPDIVIAAVREITGS